MLLFFSIFSENWPGLKKIQNGKSENARKSGKPSKNLVECWAKLEKQKCRI
jgi:hypothetical protein